MPVPKLRFKDKQGQNYPEWKVSKLGELFKVSAGGDIDKKNVRSIKTQDFCYPVYANALKNNGLYGYSNTYKIDGESFTITGRGDVGVAISRHCNYTPIVRLLVCKPLHNENVDFFAECFNKTKVYIESTGVPQLTAPQVKNIKLIYPSIPEQEKISDFLTTYDRMIDVQSQRVEAMKTRKKGLLQQIFSQKIRFKDDHGQDYPEWEVKRLEDLVSMHARIGWQNLRISEFLDSGNYYLVTGTDFVNGKIDFSTCHYIGKERFDQDKKIQLDNNNILITKDGTLGKVAYVEALPKPATLNAGVFCLKSKSINMKYLFQYLRGPFMMQYCNRHSTGGTIKHLNQGVLITFPVPVPSHPEQEKIANFLFAVDAQIDVEEKRLESMKTIKKGLLQQMFI